MNAFWIGIAAAALFFTALILLPLVRATKPKTPGSLPAAITPTTTATPAPATATPVPPTNSSNKLWWVLGLGALMLFMWFFPPNTWVNWAQTPPGQAIENSLGAGWANWVIWGVIAIVILSVAVKYLPETKKKDDSGIFSSLTWLVVVGLLILILAVTVKSYMDSPKPTFHTVDMMTWTHGQSETIPMGLSSIAILKIPGTVVGKDKHGNYGCPEAKKLSGLFPIMFEVPYGNRTDNVQLKLTDETKKKLAELNVASIDVTFTLTPGSMFDKSPCKHVVQ